MVYDPVLFLGDVHYVDTTLTLVLVTEFIKAGFWGLRRKAEFVHALYFSLPRSV